MASNNNYPIGFPVKISPWKGSTFYQVISSIQLNSGISSSLSVHQIRKPLPLKIYRRELQTQTVCNPRISTKINDMEIPGSSIVSTSKKSCLSNSLVNTIDVNLTTLSAENGACNTPNNCFSPEYNARKRVRSAGMIPRKFNTNRNNDTYNTSTQQYLVSRNRSIKQNEFNYIRKGDAGMVPGPGLAASNVYSPAGLSHCRQPMVSAANDNNTFQYTWVDGSNYTVTIPDGLYDVTNLSRAFQLIQIQNKTYFIRPNGSFVFLLGFSYDNNNQSIVMITNVMSQAQYTANSYSIPAGASWTYAGLPATDPLSGSISPFPTPTSGATFITVPDTYFADLIGFAPGTYYNGINETSFAGEILPNYVPLYFKPNNASFAVQGAVDASTRIHRLKYETITDSANSLRAAYGDATANALAYGVSEQGYTEKSVVGDKPKYTPVINPLTGLLCKRRFIYRPR